MGSIGMIMLLQRNYRKMTIKNWGGGGGTIILFVCFVALRPKSTAMVMGGWSVHLTTLFAGQA